MASYRTVEPEIMDLLAGTMAACRSDLVGAGVTVACLHAHAAINETTGEPKGPALLHHGYPAMAVARVNSQRDRVEGKTDVTILLDGDRFPALSREEKVAVFDHELWHFDLQLDDDGQVKLDDCFRPKIKIRPHDVEVGVIFDVLSRHGGNALETGVIEKLVTTLREMGILRSE